MSYEEFIATIEPINSEIDTEMARMAQLRENIMTEIDKRGKDQPVSKEARDLTKAFMDSAEKVELLTDKRRSLIKKCGEEIKTTIDLLGKSVINESEEIIEYINSLLKELGGDDDPQ